MQPEKLKKRDRKSEEECRPHCTILLSVGDVKEATEIINQAFSYQPPLNLQYSFGASMLVRSKAKPKEYESRKKTEKMWKKNLAYRIISSFTLCKYFFCWSFICKKLAAIIFFFFLDLAKYFFRLLEFFLYNKLFFK